jgi:hypothetical protein
MQLVGTARLIDCNNPAVAVLERHGIDQFILLSYLADAQAHAARQSLVALKTRQPHWL